MDGPDRDAAAANPRVPIMPYRAPLPQPCPGLAAEVSSSCRGFLQWNVHHGFQTPTNAGQCQHDQTWHGGGTCRSLEESREDMIELSGPEDCSPRLPPHSRAFSSCREMPPFSTPAQSLSLARSRRRVTRFRFSIIEGEGLRRSRRCRNSECNLPRSSAKAESSLSSRRL
jgi:hypothetical protein